MNTQRTHGSKQVKQANTILPGERSMTTHPETPISRRSALQGSAAGMGVALLAQGRTQHAAGARAQATPMPPGMTPGADFFPAPAEGVRDAYLRLPEPFTSTTGVPGSGGTVRLFTISYQAPIVAKDQNPWLQELDTRLGVTLEVDAAPAASYQERYATTVAGGDLPELSWLDIGQLPEAYRFIQQGAYLDLTDYLTGDALAEYPHLAAFPDYMWRNVAIDGRIYGVPRPEDRANILVLKWRRDWAEQFGNPNPKNADEFTELMLAFTNEDPDGNGQADTYGLGSTTNDVFSFAFFAQMFRVPNGWRLEEGRLTADLETEEYAQAVAYVRGLVEAGVYHPDTASFTVTQQRDALTGGALGAVAGTVGSIAPNREQLARFDPEGELFGLAPFGHDGGSGVAWIKPGIRGFVAIPAALGDDEERVKELLRILDYFASPFGSEEHNFLNYGIEGRHYDLVEGVPQATELADQELGSFVAFSTNPPQVWFIPDEPELGPELQQLQLQLVNMGIEDPTMTAYSETFQSEAAVLNRLVSDQLIGIFTGREALDTLDQLVADWRSRGGDQIRQEYEESLAQQ